MVSSLPIAILEIGPKKLAHELRGVMGQLTKHVDGQSMVRKRHLHTTVCNPDTFPIVRRRDKAAFGRYRTKAMLLTYNNALTVGSTDVAGAA